jgi:hypothetical protein
MDGVQGRWHLAITSATQPWLWRGHYQAACFGKLYFSFEAFWIKFDSIFAAE